MKKDDIGNSLVKELANQMPALRRYARVLMRGRDGADDLVQETLARAIKGGHRLRSVTNLRPWLFTILHNVYRSRYKLKLARNPNQYSLDGFKPDDNRSSYQAVVPGNQEDTVALRELIEALKLLPEQYRETILAIGFHGLSYKEAAETMGVSLGTVCSRIVRGRVALAKYLGYELPSIHSADNIMDQIMTLADMGPVTARDVAQRCRLSLAMAYSYLDRLVQAGSLQRVRRVGQRVQVYKSVRAAE